MRATFRRASTQQTVPVKHSGSQKRQPGPLVLPFATASASSLCSFSPTETKGNANRQGRVNGPQPTRNHASSFQVKADPTDPLSLQAGSTTATNPLVHQEWWVCVCVWGGCLSVCGYMFNSVRGGQEDMKRRKMLNSDKEPQARRIKTRKGRTVTASHSLILWCGTPRLAHSRCSVKRLTDKSTIQHICWNCTFT